MKEIRTRIQVGPDHTITGIAPRGVPRDEQVATFSLNESPPPEKRSRDADLQVYDTPWGGSISLRRENMYGDDGR